MTDTEARLGYRSVHANGTYLLVLAWQQVLVRIHGNFLSETVPLEPSTCFMKGLCQSDYLGTRVSGKLGRLSKTIDWSAHIRVLGSVCTVEFFHGSNSPLFRGESGQDRAFGACGLEPMASHVYVQWNGDLDLFRIN